MRLLSSKGSVIANSSICSVVYGILALGWLLLRIVVFFICSCFLVWHNPINLFDNISFIYEELKYINAIAYN